jgi:hypothetical protein
MKSTMDKINVRTPPRDMLDHQSPRPSDEPSGVEGNPAVAQRALRPQPGIERSALMNRTASVKG